MPIAQAKVLIVPSCVIAASLLTPISSHAQRRPIPIPRGVPTCSGPIYPQSDIPAANRAKITYRPILKPPLSSNVSGHITVEAVLCRTGYVTDVHLVEEGPQVLHSLFVNAVLGISFIPAEMNFHSVSQRMRFTWSVNETKFEEIDPSAAQGKILERIEIVGFQRLEIAEIMKHVHSHVGETYDEQQIRRDLNEILSTGLFDHNSAKVRVESGSSGVGVIFELRELPLIREVRFEGVDSGFGSVILVRLRSRQINWNNGAVYDPQKTEVATDMIKQLLAVNGRAGANVQIKSEQLNDDFVRLTIVVNQDH